MADINVVTLVGRLTRDVQLYDRGSTKIADTGLAINQKKKQDGQWIDAPVFIDLTAFGNTAEAMAMHLKKGSQIGLRGKLQMDTWSDKETGEKRSKIKVIAEDVQFLAKAGEAGSPRHEPQPPPERKQEELPPHGAPPPEDEVPF